MTPRQAEVVALYRQNLPTHEICEQLGISRQGLHQTLDRAGIEKRHREAARHDDFFDSIRSDLRRAAAAGYSINNLIDELGFGAVTITYQLERLGIELRRRRSYSAKDHARWERMYRTCSTVEIAERTGACQSAIIKHLGKVGMLRRRSHATSIALEQYWRKVRTGKIASRKYKRYSPAEHARWERLYRRLRSTNLVAKLVGASQGAVYCHLAQRGRLVSRAEALRTARERSAEARREQRAKAWR